MVCASKGSFRCDAEGGLSKHMNRSVRVVVVDDFEIVRVGLSGVLAREPDIEVVGMAESGERAMEMIAALEPDVAVVDYMLPGITGIELC